LARHLGTRRSPSIALLLIALLVLLATAVLGAFGAFNYATETRQERNNLRMENALLADQLSASLVLPVWNFDHEQIIGVMESVMKNSDVYAIVVRLADVGSTIRSLVRDEQWRVLRKDDEIPPSRTVEQARPIQHGDDIVGSVEVFLSPRFAEARLRNDLMMTVFTIGVFDLVLVLCLSLLLWRLVLRPIRSVELYAVSVSAGRRIAPRAVGTHFRGEIERLRAALESMVGLLDGRYADLQRTDAELARYRDRLEELVMQRTRELEDAQAEVLRQERLAALGQVAATVSHELRNPLGTVSNALFSLRQGLGAAASDTILRSLQLAARNVKRCDSIIDELLDYTRRGELRLENTFLDGWLREMLKELPLPAGVTLDLRLESGATIPLDREKLRKAVVNVVTNAVQAMEEEGANGSLLEICCRRGGGRVEIAVRDQGVGMSTEVQKRIWEPMFSTKTYGVGLGMSVIQAAMREQGGGVTVESEGGKGTVVVLWLPSPAEPDTPGRRSSLPGEP
jgi:signal transduction histidine kinase